MAGPQTSPANWTIRTVLDWTTDFFKGKGIDTPRLDAELLLARVLSCSRVALYCHFDEPLDEAHRAAYRALITERGRRRPIAYMLGQKEFMSLTFTVTDAVLVPRPETETLVEAALERLKGRPILAADIGTGCGAIAIAMAFHHDGCRMIATDISEPALRVAADNAKQFGVEQRIDFRQGDLFACLPEDQLDAVLSNPPYIPDSERDQMSPEASQYEPPEALFCGSDVAPIYRKLAGGAATRLKPGGWLMVEVGAGGADIGTEQIEATGAFGPVERIRDLAGICRVLIAQKEAGNG